MPRHFLIDACNLIHAWPDLRSCMEESGLDVALDHLLEIARTPADLEGGRLTLVVDGKGCELVCENPTRETAIERIFTPAGISADAILERIALRHPEPDSVWVVSRDRALGECVIAAGANMIGPERFQALVAAAVVQLRADNKRLENKVEKEWKTDMFGRSEQEKSNRRKKS